MPQVRFKHGATAHYWERLCARPSYARVLEEADPCLRELRERAA